MTKHKFAELLGSIDPALIARTETPEPARKKAGIMIAIIAAALALLACTALVIIPFIPKTYDLNYEMPKHQSSGTTVRVYYANENGKLQSERVKMPDSAQNVFLTWQHLNEIDEQVQLLDYQITTEPMAGTTVVPDTLWKFVMQQMGKRDEQTIVTATLSAGITSYENQDALIESLIQTIAKYAGVSPEQVRILIDGETIGIIVPLQFWHNLQGGGDVFIGTGDTLEITVGMTNISDEIIHYTGSSSAFVPDAVLIMGDVVIEHEIYPHTEDEVELSLAPGESREVTYRFVIPNDAPTGTYDLVVSFRGYSLHFKGAFEVVVLTHTAIQYIPEYFGAFLDEYSFTSAEPSEFKQAFGSLNYQGTRVFDLMSRAAVDWMPGYSGEIWIGDGIEYQYSIFQADANAVPVIKNHFTITTLPDGMTLLCGECHSGTLAGALEALGYDAQAAQDLIAQKSDVILASDASYYFSLTCQGGIYALAYCDVVFFDGSAVLRQMQMRYDEQTGAFMDLYISTSTSGFSIPATVKRTSQGVSVNWPLSDLQALQLLEMVNTGRWEEDWPIRTDFTLTPIIKLGNNSIMFEEEWLLAKGSLELTAKQKKFIRELLGSFTVYEGNVAFHFATSEDSVAYVPLDEQQTQAVLDMLNQGEWKQGIPELECDTNCSVGNLSLSYDASTGIFIHGDKYLNLSKENADMINAILDMYR